MSAGRIELLRTDITRLAVDAIVNAANPTLLGGGGVDGAIHRAAGPELLAECRTLGGCPPGQSKLTHGYRLPAPWVIHTVGPIWRGGVAGEDDTLASCYRTALGVAADRRFTSVAFPAISCGVYGFPVPRACRIAVGEIRLFLATPTSVERVCLVAFDGDVQAAYRALLDEDSLA
jgi:O-acetyl-ADP-ribose deacetylase (regulator of RNase III)